MASEVLAVPEEHLIEVCEILRLGLRKHPKVTPEVRQQLLTWVAEQEAYMNGDEDDG